MSPRKYTESRKENNKKWDAANLDRISIAAPKGAKDRWKAVAASLDKSLNQFIVDAVNEKASQKAAGSPTIPVSAIGTSLPAEIEKHSLAASDGRTEEKEV